jgi:transcription antitermination factor NusG
MLHWYAFQSKARKEQLVYEQLRIRQIETFFPKIRVRPINSRLEKIQPYFPGYVFGHLDLDTSNRSLLDWLPGAVGIVNFGGEPVPVPDHLIHVLRQHLETVNASDTEISKKFQRGDVVTIRGGPFAGYSGIFNSRLPGRDRVEVLLKMLQGSYMRVELSIEQIARQTK